MKMFVARPRMNLWRATAAAAPRNIVVMLSDRIRKTMTAPDRMQRYRERGLDVIASTPDEFAAHLKSELQKRGSVIRERGMRAE